MKTLHFVLNGQPAEAEVQDNEILLHALRERLSIKSVKEGCSIGECGVCTVLVDDEPVYSCLTLASKVDGHDVKTVEYLAEGDRPPSAAGGLSFGRGRCSAVSVPPACCLPPIVSLSDVRTRQEKRSGRL